MNTTEEYQAVDEGHVMAILDMSVKKEVRQVNSNLKRGIQGSPTCIKSKGDNIGIPDSCVMIAR